MRQIFITSAVQIVTSKSNPQEHIPAHFNSAHYFNKNIKFNIQKGGTYYGKKHFYSKCMDY